MRKIGMVTRGEKNLRSSCKNGDHSNHTKQHMMTQPELCTSCQRLLDVSGLWKLWGMVIRVYGHVIPVGRILSVGGSFESMTE
jgi:hypothetical protein